MAGFLLINYKDILGQKGSSMDLPQGNRFKRTRTGESGQAFLEFALVLPFLILLLAGILDVGLMINEHLSLSNVAQSGIRLAQQTAELEVTSAPHPRSHYVNTVLLPCTYNQAVPNPLPPDGSQIKLVHDRVIRVLCLLQQRGQLRFIRSDTIILEITRLPPDASVGAPDDQDTVSLSLWADYDGFLPFFRGLTIAARSTGPYLY